MSALADRIRGIVTAGAQRTAVVPPPMVAAGTAPAVVESDPSVGAISQDVAAILGGEWRRGASGQACFVVERRWDPAARYGCMTIGEVAESFRQASDTAALFAGGGPAGAPFVFFDLETTGLSGGAGTHAFLVGCGWFDQDRFVTRQFLMTKYADERALLETVAGELAHAGALVTFNGKSFDAPVLETRYLFHRLAWVGDRIPHIDALHPARRFWPGDCSLVALERLVVRARRAGDVSGFEIPARYFQFVRSGNPRPLVAVLEHTRLDLLTLAAVTARLLQLARSGPSGARDGREAYALGTVYARAGLDARARACFMRAVELSPAPPGAFEPLRIEGLRALALGWRRARQWDEAAACWRQLLDTRGCPPPIRREAAEALAIHHEHRVRDFAAAKTFAMRNLESGLPPVWTQAVRHRLARLERKMDRESTKYEVRSLQFEV